MKGTKQLKGGERRTPITRLTTPRPLPDVLLTEAVSVKLLWAYLLPKSIVAYSSYSLGEALGLSQRASTAGLSRLRNQELRLIEDLGERRARVRAVYQAVEPRGNPTNILTPVTDAPRDPLHLPKALKGETPTTRLVYLYLEPYGEVEVSVRQLEGLLGISHRNATEALQRLVELGLLEGLKPAANRVGRYRVR